MGGRAIVNHITTAAAEISGAAQTAAVAGGDARRTTGRAAGTVTAAARGLPDLGLLSMREMADNAGVLARAVSIPVIAAADTGGDALAFQYLAAKLEALGVSLIIVEDKVFPKRTSLAAGVRHDLEDPVAFADKIAKAKAAMLTDDVLIFARIESLIAGAYAV